MDVPVPDVTEEGSVDSGLVEKRFTLGNEIWKSRDRYADIVSVDHWG